MAGHQVVGVCPSGQGPYPLAPRRDMRAGRGIETEFFGWEIEISGQRDIRDGGLGAEEKRLPRQSFLDDGEVVVDASLEEGQHGGVAGRLGEAAQETIGTEE